MIVDSTEHQLLTSNKPIRRSSPPSVPHDEPPAYSPALPTRSPATSVPLSGDQQTEAPLSQQPVNGLVMHTKREAIRGSWSLDPLLVPLPTKDLVQMFLDGKAAKKKCFRAPKGVPPTAKFISRHGNIETALRITGDGLSRSTATIRSKTRSGNITLELVSISPMRTVHIDARSRRGNVTLLVPRNFCGLVQLSSRHGPVDVLPALAASGRIVMTKNKETTVLIGDGPVPEEGLEYVTDTARLYSRHGRIRLGYSGEDYFTEPPKLIDQAVKMVQKLVMDKLITPRITPKRGLQIAFS